MAYWTLLANKNSCKGRCKLQEPKDVINQNECKMIPFFIHIKNINDFVMQIEDIEILLTCNVLKCILFYFTIRCTKGPNRFKYYSNQFISIKMKY
jgi:hypothetical protein